MPTAGNAILYYESAQTFVDYEELTDQGDYKDFKSVSTLWSGRSGYAPTVRPDGLVTGGAIVPAVTGTNDLIDVAALTCYLSGVLTSVVADADVTVNRASGSATDYQKHSVTITSGGAVAVVEGAEGSSFSSTRGAAGGPPYIDNDAIEIGQVWYSSQTPAAVLATEIYQTVGTHRERYDYPVWAVEHIDVSSGILGYAGVLFQSALQQIHSEDAGSTIAGKPVWASYYTPSFAEVVDAYDFVPPASAHSVNSTQVYGRTKAAKASSLNQGSFSVHLSDGITDGMMQFVDANLWFKFFPERLNVPYILCQGSLGVTANFPAGDNIGANCTVTAEVAADRVNG
jgi:hypothetical protein